MTNIFMDMEWQNMQKAPKEVRRICHQEVIEIGAVAVNDRGKNAGTFKSFVKPQYITRISAKISDLTGISTEQVVGAAGFADVFHEFMGWCSSFEEPVVYSWSTSDLIQLNDECLLKGVAIGQTEKDIMIGWHDLQKEFNNLIHAEQPTGLERAVNLCGYESDGHKHDAYWDAWNTARIFKATRDTDSFYTTLEKMKEILSYDAQPITMGSLFDFSTLSLSA